MNYDLGSVDLLIVNEIEARALVPDAVAAGNDAEVASWLAERYPGMEVVLTAGGEGLHYATGSGENGVLEAHAAIPVQPVDETAAGDAFIGYLMAGLLAGQSVSSALRLASAAGACAVTVPGAASSIPTREAVQALLTEHA